MCKNFVSWNPDISGTMISRFLAVVQLGTVLVLAPACHPPPPAISAAAAPSCALARDRINVADTRAVLTSAGIDAERLRCNTDTSWETSHDAYAAQIVDGLAQLWSVSPDPALRKKARHHALGYLVRSFYEQTQQHNLGVTALKGRTYVDSRGQTRPLLVFRSSLIVGRSNDASPCFHSLIEHGGVRHVFNLYTGTFPFRDMLDAEKALAIRLGASYLDGNDTESGNWRQLVEEEKDYHKNLDVASRRLAQLLRSILRPGGQAPRGNLYFHCAGGMHRSGMVFGVLRRCINGDPLEQIEAEYKRHVAYRSPQQPGGFEALNLRLIRDFDCALLK
jgi:hypothetical protein